MWDTPVTKNRISAVGSITFNHQKKGEGENFFSLIKNSMVEWEDIVIII